MLNANSALVGQRNAFACEFGAAIVEAGLDAPTTVSVVAPTLDLVRQYAEIFKIPVDLDMDGAGREVEAWLSRVDRSARRAEDGDEVRGLGSLWQRRRGLVAVLRSLAQELRLAEAERPTLRAEDAERAMAEALSADAPIIALNVSPGAGKSRAGRAWVAAGGGRTYVATPTHALNKQTKKKLLAETKIDAHAREPSLLALRRPDGSPICGDPERVELAMYAGDRPTSACSGCRHRATCAPAIEAARTGRPNKKRGARHVVFTHAGAPRELNAIVARGDAPGSRTLIDECPPLFHHGRWSAFDADKHLERYLTPRGAAIFAAVSPIERGEDVGEEARQAARMTGPLLLRGAPKGARAFVRALRALAEAIASGVERDFLVRTHLKNGRPSTAWRAPAPWVRAVREYAAAGGQVCIVDATLDPDGIREVFGVAVRAIHVADAPGTRRVYVGDDGVATPKSSGDIDGVCGKIVRDVRLAIGDAQPAKIGLVTWREWKEDVAAALRIAFPCAEVLALHYGGERGLDDLEECELLITAGDPWVAAAAIGADPTTKEGKQLWDNELQRWLIQAHGRARSARIGGKTIVHIGSVAPDPRVAPQWAQCVILRPGRRAVSVASTPLSALGLSVRDLARVLGCSPSTAHRRLAAEFREQNRADPIGGTLPVIDREIDRPTKHTQEPYVDPGAPVPPMPPEEREAMVCEPMEDHAATHAAPEAEVLPELRQDERRESGRNDPSASLPAWQAVPAIGGSDDPPGGLPGSELRRAEVGAEFPDYGAVSPGAVEEYEALLRRLAAEMSAGRGDGLEAADLREQMDDVRHSLSMGEKRRMDALSESLHVADEPDEELPDPWDGANAKPFRQPDRIQHPFPTTDLVGKCPLPQPPRLKKTQVPEERVALLLKAFRAVYACRFPKSPMQHFYRNVRDLRKAKLWPALLAAADAMLADDIPPHLWVDWSIEQFYAQKAAPPRDRNGQGPPWMWILSVKRIAKQGNWFRATACGTGGMVLLSHEAEDVIARYRIASSRLAHEDENDVFRELFPLGYFNECHGAAVETERMFAILKRLRDSWDVHLWARYEKEIRRILAPEIERELWGG